MNRDPYIARQDRPLDRESGDALDRSPFVDSLVRALIHDDRDAAGTIIKRRATGFVVGLTGRWGLGKSSILYLLSLKLSSMSNVVVVTFNPWLFKGREELLRAYFSSLREAMGRSKIERAREMVGALDKYWAAIDWMGRAAVSVIDLHGGAGAANKARGWVMGISRAIIRKPSDISPEAERKALEAKLAELNAAVVILIDELDRVEDEEVRAVAQLIKAVGDIKGISYLVAYDPVRVADALGRGYDKDERRRSGEAYLEKIVQHPIPLRPLFTADTEALLSAALTDHGITLAAADANNERNILDYLIGAISTPREVKRLIGAFSVLEEAMRGEICPYDVLGYSWILTKSPSLRDEIAANLERVVDDPSETEMMARAAARMNTNPPGNSRPEPVDLLGSEATAHNKILKLLFPRFSAEENTSNGHRISRRRNLVRLLYLGNPPGMVTRSQLEHLWSITDPDELEAALRTLQAAGTLSSVIDRLDDLLPLLPTSGDRTFWVALDRLFVRSTDWVRGAENTRSLAEDAATTLMRLAIRDGAYIPRVKEAFNALVEAGDLVMAPWILRKHMFAHGLNKHRPAKSAKAIFTKEETAALLTTEIPRYRAAILDGTVLRRITNCEAIYVISNRDQWDAELRNGFTAQLIDLDALGTLAAILVPPGYSSERPALDELFDASVVADRISEEIQTRGWPDDAWVADCLRRLRAILMGRDPMFLDDENGEEA
jgi:hypothetical protein